MSFHPRKIASASPASVAIDDGRDVPWKAREIKLLEEGLFHRAGFRQLSQVKHLERRILARFRPVVSESVRPFALLLPGFAQ